ncbi:DUF4142 domain-containing protein [Silvimonas iriomotensis]|uniref:DUF4142 domain-containing protein n=1 Tax=Silvimonas iriomotensis TaxID=449662 RepID=A0ABQ2P6D7_9NEIS|nr:DUF4142 domain-containing protein [Silvimonas iriomotensis]GGP18965.1 hypothetical protein GCM10010970_08270 [Silvimonas iriomotensis]
MHRRNHALRVSCRLLAQCLLPGVLILASAGAVLAADASPVASSTAARTPLRPADAAFVDGATRANLAEIRLGQLMLQRSAVPEVKFFAQRMVQEHQTNLDGLNQLASQKGIRLTDDLSVADKELYDRLSKLPSPQLEHDYIGVAGLKGHLEAQKLFQGYLKEGKDQDLLSYAQMTLPTINDHLEMARHLLANSKSE